jgi:hypothetical protein
LGENEVFSLFSFLFFSIWEHFQKRMGWDEFWDSIDVTVPNQNKTMTPISRDLDV